ncbi:MAG: 3-hydroxyacyl-CoA dehydrogenase NAD-binding domain-containing protein [Bythopirellula sp.]
MSDEVRISKQGDIGVLTIDSPPVNALAQPVRAGLVDGLRQLAADESVAAVVLHCAERTFVAGADINELGAAFGEPDFHTLFVAIEKLRCPVIATLFGTTLGGGLELAMACDYRVATPTGRCGMPEVFLGIIPGGEGTQRLPRLIGIEPALRMITGGKPISAREANQLGLVDALIDGGDDGTGLEAAVNFARQVVAKGGKKRLASEITDHAKGLADDFFASARDSVVRQSRGLQSPLRALEAIEAAATLSFDAGVAREAEIFAECLETEQSVALRYLFFAERQCAKIPDIPEDLPTPEIDSAFVIGAGTMGTGISMNFANAAIPVSLYDKNPESLERSISAIEKNYAGLVKKGRLTEAEAAERVSRVTPVDSWDLLPTADIVVEAVFEDMALKKEVFGKLNTAAKPAAILATNTSMLDIGEIAAETDRPEQVIGLHFFSPAQIMKLVEVVRAETTGKETLATSMALVKSMKKVGVPVRVCDGFVGNRMVFPYVREACFLLEEGALPQQVDGALQRFGFAMGPHAMCDLAGQDVFWLIRQRQNEDRQANERYSTIQDKICEQQRFGQKTGSGMYLYVDGSRKPTPDPTIEAMIVAESAALGIERRQISDQEIVDRCVYALVNEGAKILEAGIVSRASDIDVVYLYGYGFPGFRGGPMYYADSVGLDTVYEKICQFAERDPELWQPAPLLEKLAKAGGRFVDA